MNRRLWALLLFACMCIALGGCKLARADGMETEQDKLVGVFITKEYLDLFDMEGYLNDNIASLSKGGNIEVKDDGRYQGRIYAELIPQTYTNEETGEKSEHWEYAFTEVDGVPFFYARVAPPEGDSYYANSSGDIVCDGHFTVGDNMSLKGTLYITPESLNTVYINPVYQQADGRLFVTTGSGNSFVGDRSEGIAVTTTLEEMRTVTENGEKREESCRVEISIALKYPPKSVSIIRMNSEDAVLSREEYAPETLPKSMNGDGAAYIVVETHSASSSGETVSRELYEPGDTYFTSYSARADGFCEGKYVGLEWE